MTTWAHPLPPGPERDRWIGVVLDMQIDDDHFTAHAVLVRKVLHEPWQVALPIAARFRRHALTRAECEDLADGWWEPGVSG